MRRLAAFLAWDAFHAVRAGRDRALPSCLEPLPEARAPLTSCPKETAHDQPHPARDCLGT
jgi:hypothetical protein